MNKNNVNKYFRIDYIILVTYAIRDITNSTDKELCGMDYPSDR